jgi:excisionase family DNA binding protein
MAEVLTLEEVADFLHVHSSTIYRLLKNRRIPAFKVGSDWRFNQESIEQWVKKLEAEQPACSSAPQVVQPVLVQRAR